MPDGGVITRSSMAAGFARIARMKSEWAGLPVPMMGERIVMEKSYTYADVMAKINDVCNPVEGINLHVDRIDDINEETALRNEWWSPRERRTIRIWQVGKRFRFDKVGSFHSLDYAMRTLGCSDAWSLETEFRAMATLQSLVTPRAFRHYLLTGSFLETSKRSQVTYVFRRLKPTIALSGRTGQLRVLAVLCMHPIAYYQGSWAGAMCPTDDVLAHLMMMRADERMLWRRANQHHASTPEAGL